MIPKYVFIKKKCSGEQICHGWKVDTMLTSWLTIKSKRVIDSLIQNNNVVTNLVYKKQLNNNHLEKSYNHKLFTCTEEFIPKN